MQKKILKSKLEKETVVGNVFFLCNFFVFIFISDLSCFCQLNTGVIRDKISPSGWSTDESVRHFLD